MVLSKMKLDSGERNIWFTSDWHINHAKIIDYCNRPFEEVEEMDESIMENFDSLVSKNDIVFFLGDIAFGEDMAKHILNLITKKAEVHFILGNHDMRYINTISSVANSVNTLLDIQIDDQPITLCHYPMRTWHKSHFDSIQLFGHVHGRLQPKGKQWDVGVDNNRFLPVSYETIKHIMKTQPHNENYIDKNDNCKKRN